MTAITDCHFPTELITNYSFAAAFSSALAPIRFTFNIGANLIFIPAISLLSEDDKPSFSTVFLRVPKASYNNLISSQSSRV